MLGRWFENVRHEGYGDPVVVIGERRCASGSVPTLPRSAARRRRPGVTTIVGICRAASSSRRRAPYLLPLPDLGGRSHAPRVSSARSAACAPTRRSIRARTPPRGHAPPGRDLSGSGSRWSVTYRHVGRTRSVVTSAADFLVLLAAIRGGAADRVRQRPGLLRPARRANRRARRPRGARRDAKPADAHCSSSSDRAGTDWRTRGTLAGRVGPAIRAAHERARLPLSTVRSIAAARSLRSRYHLLARSRPGCGRRGKRRAEAATHSSRGPHNAGQLRLRHSIVLSRSPLPNTWLLPGPLIGSFQRLTAVAGRIPRGSNAVADVALPGGRYARDARDPSSRRSSTASGRCRPCIPPGRVRPLLCPLSMVFAFAVTIEGCGTDGGTAAALPTSRWATPGISRVDGYRAEAGRAVSARTPVPSAPVVSSTRARHAATSRRRRDRAPHPHADGSEHLARSHRRRRRCGRARSNRDPEPKICTCRSHSCRAPI